MELIIKSYILLRSLGLVRTQEQFSSEYMNRPKSWLRDVKRGHTSISASDYDVLEENLIKKACTLYYICTNESKHRHSAISELLHDFPRNYIGNYR